ncbi:MAG TPA: ABC transporter ATP-binding protein [Thermomicrobiaceae bacterium]|nr:ABC transporter ATP-binding protein [Thermomicrobiaceae bacterium]
MRSSQLPIEAKQLTKRYGAQRGVTGLTFSVEPGEVFGFLGPNGAGKTTTIRQLLGLIRPTSGSVHVFGYDCWSESKQTKASIGYLPGDIHLYENLTGQEFLAFFAAFRSAAVEERRVAELAQRLEIDLRRKIKHLSKGNRQKIGIIQALMHGAPLLILDEPSSGLDPLKQVDFIELLREEKERGTTILLSSHALVEVERIADRVAIVREGELVAVEQMSAIRRLQERRLALRLREPAPALPERVRALDGVSVVSVDPSGLNVELAVRGAVQPLLRLLAELPVDDFTFGPADLESVFLHYYGAAPDAAPEPALKGAVV